MPRPRRGALRARGFWIPARRAGRRAGRRAFAARLQRGGASELGEVAQSRAFGPGGARPGPSGAASFSVPLAPPGCWCWVRWHCAGKVALTPASPAAGPPSPGPNRPSWGPRRPGRGARTRFERSPLSGADRQPRALNIRLAGSSGVSKAYPEPSRISPAKGPRPGARHRVCYGRLTVAVRARGRPCPRQITMAFCACCSAIRA